MFEDSGRGWVGNGRMEFLSIAVSPWLLVKTSCKVMRQVVMRKRREGDGE